MTGVRVIVTVRMVRVRVWARVRDRVWVRIK